MEERKLTRQELIDYFKDVFELESQIYTYERIEPAYTKILSYIGIPQQLRFAHFDSIKRKMVDGMDNLLTSIPTIYGERLEYTDKPGWTNTQEYKDIVTKKTKTHSIAFLKISSSKTTYDYDEKKLKDYFAKCLEQESLKIAQNEKPLRHHLEKEYEELIIKPKKEAKALLEKLYSKNIIFPKYRNFAIVAQIYEYLLSGRCDQLEGPYGAYNLYESELRQNIIINRLDEIIIQLERLNSTMGTMCGAIHETNYLLGNISRTLGRIEANTALTAYNSQCIAHNTRIASQYVL